MKNVGVRVEDGQLVLTVDLGETFGPSTSGKTTIIASTEGNQSVPGHEDIKFGVNVFKKR